jgi:hypothetical protein
MQAEKSKIRVKIMTRGSYSKDAHRSLLRQFPDSFPSWGECDFIFDPVCRHYDWFVVYHDMPDYTACGKIKYVEDLKCPPENTIHINYEPSSITTYGKHYLRQFGHVITTQEQKHLNHPRVIPWQAGMPWFYGRSAKKNEFIAYNDLYKMNLSNKSRLFSTVCSTKKQHHTLHKARLNFTLKLKDEFPEMEIFGRGHKEIEDKADALNSYKYHLVIENHQAPNHWTEKLSDTYLGLCLPFYHGCPNVVDYFPQQSFIPIDINDPQEAKKIIKESIAGDEYAKRRIYIEEARRNVLTKHNLFACLAGIIPNLETGLPHPLKDGYLFSRKALWAEHPLARIECLYEKTKLFVRNLV